MQPNSVLSVAASVTGSSAACCRRASYYVGKSQVCTDGSVGRRAEAGNLFSRNELKNVWYWHEADQFGSSLLRQELPHSGHGNWQPDARPFQCPFRDDERSELYVDQTLRPKPPLRDGPPHWSIGSMCKASGGTHYPPPWATGHPSPSYTEHQG